MPTPTVPNRRQRAPRKPPPVSSFGPELMAALIRGAKDTFEVTMPYRLAVQFARRVNSLRASMLVEGHPAYPMVKRTKVRIAWGEAVGLPAIETWANSQNALYPKNKEDPVKVIIEPHDRAFSDALIAAGMTAEELKEDPLAAFEAKPGEIASPPTEDFLDQFVPQSSKKVPGV